MSYRPVLPCTEYSVAKSIGVRDLKKADKIVKKCLQIIEYFEPKKWFVENPGGPGLLNKRPFMPKFNHLKNECCYCMYGHPYRKRTNIWSNVKLNLKTCTHSNPCDMVKQFGKHPIHIDGRISVKTRNTVPVRLLKKLI